MAPELSVAEPAEPVLARSEQVESLETPVPADELAPPVAADDADVAADAAATEAAAVADAPDNLPAGDEAAAEEPAAEEAEADPSLEIREALRRAPGDWYVVHSYAGYENRVKTNLETRTSSLNMEDYIFQIEVPTREESVVKHGVR